MKDAANMKTLFALFLIAACALGTGAGGQTSSKPSAAGCPLAAEISPVHLYGLWRADFDGLSPPATLLFEKHPELADSVRGGINRDGV